MSSPIPAALANASIPLPSLKVLSRLKEAGYRAYLVGGCVRDLLRGAKPKDFDIATSARPEEVQRIFPKTIPTGIQHGTITVRMEGENLEVTTFRTEGAYHDGRRPSEVQFRTEIEEDLGRRDFTFNAMAFDPVSHQLVDPFDGQQDLQARLVRCVRDPVERFNEDGLRTLRAVRFAAVLDCALDPATEAAIPGALPVFRKVAQERVQVELEKTLLSGRPGWGVSLLAKTGLWAAILPELTPLKDETIPALDRSVPRAEVRLALLFSVVGLSPLEPLRRLKFPNKVLDRAALLVAHRDLSPYANAEGPELRRFLSRVGLEPLQDLFDHARALSPTPQTEKAIRQLSEQAAQKPPLSAKDLALNGGEIMRVLQVRPSPIVGEATRFLLDSVLGDPALNQADRLTEMLRIWGAGRSL